ncbi:MAG: hypothetical protein COW59_02110, partial [Lysobacterales bacterium CG17_big_fil_post_rev_8_21_14_2_50_64_11]
MEQAGSKLDGARVFNHYSLAGVILFHAPRVSVFIDSRVDLYEKAGILDDYLEIHGLDPGWDVLLDAWKVDAIIYPTTHPLIHALTQR